MVNNTILEIDTNILKNNIKEITKKYNNYKYFIGVVKGDAYGHGLEICKYLDNSEINIFAVSTYEEAKIARKYTKKDILILEPISIDNINEAINNNFTLTISSVDYINEMKKIDIKGNLKVHLKIDSGMNRLGFKENINEVYEKLSKNNNILIEGLYTHFATTGIFDKYWDIQINKFKELTKELIDKVKYVHIANSTTMINHDKPDFVNTVRLGSVMYGFNVGCYKSNKTIKDKLRNIRNSYYQKKYNISKVNYNVKLNTKTSMKLKTSIIEMKEIKKGEPIGYGAHYIANENIKIAIIPVGYNNGIGTNEKNRYALINGKKYPFIGSINMNMSAIKIDEKVSYSDEVILLGETITISDLAQIENIIFSKMLLDIGKSNIKKYIEKE